MLPAKPGGFLPDQPDHPERPWWGLGDVVLGVVAALVVSVLATSIAYAVTGWSATDKPPLWGVALLQVPLWAALAGTVVWASKHKGLGLRADFGWAQRPWDAPLGIVVGVAMQLLVLPLVYLPLLHLLGKSSEELERPARELSDRATGTASWVLLFLIVAVFAPVVEELFYRGLLLRSLDKAGVSVWASVLISAALFGAMHFEALQFVGLFLFGVVLAAIVERTGRLAPAIWAHAAFNAATVVSLWARR